MVDAPATDSVWREAAPGDRASALAEAHKLSRLRELALLVAARVVDRQLESYLRSHGMDQPWGVQERILVCVTPRVQCAPMLESGRRNADRFQGEFHVVYVQERRSLATGSSGLESRIWTMPASSELDVEVLSGFDTAEAILKFAKQAGITQIFVGHSTRHGAQTRIWGNLVDRLIRSAEGIDVVVYPQ